MNYFKYNLLNLKKILYWLPAPISFVIYWKVTRATDAPYNVVYIAVAVLIAGISVGNYIKWRKL